MKEKSKSALFLKRASELSYSDMRALIAGAMQDCFCQCSCTGKYSGSNADVANHNRDTTHLNKML